MQIYNETILPNYQEQKEKAAECIAKIDEASGNFTRQSMAMILQAEGKTSYNESVQIARSFKKKEIDPNEYMNKFISSRKRYYEMMEYSAIVCNSMEV